MGVCNVKYMPEVPAAMNEACSVGEKGFPSSQGFGKVG